MLYLLILISFKSWDLTRLYLINLIINRKRKFHNKVLEYTRENIIKNNDNNNMSHMFSIVMSFEMARLQFFLQYVIYTRIIYKNILSKWTIIIIIIIVIPIAIFMILQKNFFIIL
jgi:hypothetical protein